jgi:hypothetical protein
MTPVRRPRLYVGLFLIASGAGASLLGLRAERFVGTRHAEIVDSHARLRADLVRLSADPAEEPIRRRLAEHDNVVVPRTLDRYRFGILVAKSMQFGGVFLAAIGLVVLVSYVLRRQSRIAGEVSHR